MKAGIGLGVFFLAALLWWSAATGRTGDVLGALLSPTQLKVDTETAATQALVVNTNPVVAT